VLHILAEVCEVKWYRNKEEGYFIACEILKQLCTSPKGVEAIRCLPSMLKRLHALAEDLTKKVNHEKRLEFAPSSQPY